MSWKNDEKKNNPGTNELSTICSSISLTIFLFLWHLRFFFLSFLVTIKMTIARLIFFRFRGMASRKSFGNILGNDNKSDKIMQYPDRNCSAGLKIRTFGNSSSNLYKNEISICFCSILVWIFPHFNLLNKWCLCDLVGANHTKICICKFCMTTMNIIETIIIRCIF